MSRNVFDRLRSGEAVPFNDPQYSQIRDAAVRTAKLLAELNKTGEMAAKIIRRI